MAGLAPLTAAPAGALGKVIMIDITVATISGIDPLRYALRSSVDDTRAKTDNDAMRHAKRVSGLARHFTQGGNRVCLHLFLQLNQALSPICTMLMQLFRQLNQILISIFILLLTYAFQSLLQIRGVDASSGALSGVTGNVDGFEECIFLDDMGMPSESSVGKLWLNVIWKQELVFRCLGVRGNGSPFLVLPRAV